MNMTDRELLAEPPLPLPWQSGNGAHGSFPHRLSLPSQGTPHISSSDPFGLPKERPKQLSTFRSQIGKGEDRIPRGQTLIRGIRSIRQYTICPVDRKLAFQRPAVQPILQRQAATGFPRVSLLRQVYQASSSLLSNPSSSGTASLFEYSRCA